MPRPSFVRILLPALLAFALLGPAQGFAQTTGTGPGAGTDAELRADPGLTAPREIAPEDVPLYIPDEEQTTGRVSIPDAKLATLVQPEGRTWRGFRMDTLMWVAGIVILGMLAALSVFYLWRGTIRLERGRSGRTVPRFNGLERFAHWTAAVSFLILAFTGLIVTFGRYLLIPVIGQGAFAPVADASKYLHNFASVPFVIGIAIMLVVWIRDNIPSRADLIWLRQAGGMFAKHGSSHPETARFNAGQKGVFWTVILGGLVMAVTGYVLMTPFYWVGVGGMQIVHVVHAVLAALMIAAILGHIYIGTLGMEGAFDAMAKGEVDENWAIEHHRGWYEEQRRAQRGAPTGAPGGAPRGARRAGAD
ncbi:MAG TPA: formate dehydrogenase subunit gamma [Arenibaculum sp.]|nr:formate dehydrogenase subunit gamma [Arenibaculum sp.]